RWILLAAFRGEHAFVISQDVQHEVLEVMQEKFPRRREEAREVLSLLRVEIVPRRAYARRSREFPRLRDPRDAHVLAAAIVSHCDAIVTGDRDLVVLGAVESVSILRPSQARRLITGVAGPGEIPIGRLARWVAPAGMVSVATSESSIRIRTVSSADVGFSRVRRIVPVEGTPMPGGGATSAPGQGYCVPG